jgi:hypothetical protein
MKNCGKLNQISDPRRPKLRLYRGDKPVVGFPISIDSAQGHHACEVVSSVGIWNSTKLSFRLAVGFAAAANPKNTLKLGAQRAFTHVLSCYFHWPAQVRFCTSAQNVQLSRNWRSPCQPTETDSVQPGPNVTEHFDFRLAMVIASAARYHIPSHFTEKRS